MGLPDTLLLAFHLLCMNLAATGPLVAAALDVRAARWNPPEVANQAARWLAWVAVFAALLGALSGLGLGLLKWNDHYSDTLGLFRGRLEWGLAEYFVSLVVMAIYAALVFRHRTASHAARWGRSLLAVISGTNLLYHFPPLFTMIAAASSGRWQLEPVTSATFRELLTRDEVPALSVHFAVGSVAVCGAAILFHASRHPTVAGAPDLGRWGARLALIATLLQIPVGLWLTVSLPATAQQRVLGADPISTGLLIGSLVATLSLLRHLADCSWGDATPSLQRRAVALLILVVVLMSGVVERMNG